MSWVVWVIGSHDAHALPLPESGEVCVGRRGAGPAAVADAGVADAHLVLVPLTDGVLEARALAPVLLNDVQLVEPTRLRGGDELVLGGARLLVLEHRAVAPSAPLSRRDYEALRQGVFLGPGAATIFLARLPPTKDRADRLVQLLAALPAGTYLSELGPATLELLWVGDAARGLDEIAARLVEAGAQGMQWASRTAAEHGLGEVLELAFNRFLRMGSELPEESSFADPVMLRILAALERADSTVPAWVFLGERGSGREALARLFHARVCPQGPFVHVRRPRSVMDVAERAGQAAEGTLYVDLEASPPSGEAPWAAWEQAAQGARRFILGAGAAPPGASWVLPFPPLRDRPLDIRWMAESLLERFARVAGRSPLSLAPAAREVLQGYAFPENARELRNAMAAAALASSGAETTAEALPFEIQRAGGRARAPETLRTTLDQTERETLLATLARTRWNVTRAAQVLGIPRRTVVYRMARLGLRRPVRS